MKKISVILFVSLILLSLAACGKTKVLHCDHCNKEVFVKQNSNMDEDWIIYCEECNEELFGDDPLLGNN